MLLRSGWMAIESTRRKTSGLVLALRGVKRRFFGGEDLPRCTSGRCGPDDYSPIGMQGHLWGGFSPSHGHTRDEPIVRRAIHCAWVPEEWAFGYVCRCERLYFLHLKRTWEPGNDVIRVADEDGTLQPYMIRTPFGAWTPDTEGRPILRAEAYRT